MNPITSKQVLRVSEDKGESDRRGKKEGEREEMSPYHLVVHAVLDSALARLAHHGLEGELAAYVDRSEVVVDLVPT